MANGLTCRVEAATLGGGVSEVQTKQSVVQFDSSPRQGEELPEPADLLTAAFAACVLKNVERMAEVMPFRFETAHVEVRSQRQDRPPMMVRFANGTQRILEIQPAPRRRRDAVDGGSFAH